MTHCTLTKQVTNSQTLRTINFGINRDTSTRDELHIGDQFQAKQTNTKQENERLTLLTLLESLKFIWR